MSASNDGLTLNTAAFDAAVARLMVTSKKAAVDVMKQQAKLLFVEVAKLTPPYSGNVTGRQAEKRGAAAVRADIKSLYGTVGDAYDEIAAKSPAKASAFWLLSKTGEADAANRVMYGAIGRNMEQFDGGALHQRVFRQNFGRKRYPKKSVFTFDKAELEKYIAREQTHVWWLASGWASALRALDAKMPYGVNKHDAPGRLRVEITSSNIEIAMTNEVRFGGRVRDIERRIQWVLNKRTRTLDNAWHYYLNRAARDAGFSKSI